MPLNGDWKTLVRLHKGNSLTGLPVYLPADEAIPVDEVPATSGATREFIADHEILQREQLTAAARPVGGAYAVVLLITLSFLALIAWGLHRLAVTAEPPGRGGPAPERSRPAPVGGPIGGVPMSGVLLPLADHGNVVSALPFVVADGRDRAGLAFSGRP